VEKRDSVESNQARSASWDRLSEGSEMANDDENKTNGVTFNSQILEASINGTVTPGKICLLSPSSSGSSGDPESSDTWRDVAVRSAMPQATPLSRKAGTADIPKTRPPRPMAKTMAEPKTSKSGPRRPLHVTGECHG
jgi:hypothetical protein